MAASSRESKAGAGWNCAPGSYRTLMWLPGRGRGALHLPISEWLDFNEPPMFKSFLRVDAGDAELRIRCFAATGCAAQEDDPPVEDELIATTDAAGRWTWTARPRRCGGRAPGAARATR